MYADEGVIKIKHDVLTAVAKMAFDGTLEKERDFLPEKLIPGPNARFRCCIYKEREIIRERVRLACGEAPGPEDNGNIIQVLHAACEDCPISSYVVTDNCQNCLGKACVSACKFDACRFFCTYPSALWVFNVFFFPFLRFNPKRSDKEEKSFFMRRPIPWVLRLLRVK